MVFSDNVTEIDTILLTVITISMLSALVILGYTKYVELRKLRVSSEHIQKNTKGLFAIDELDKMYRAAFKSSDNRVLIVNSDLCIVDCNYNFEDSITSAARVVNVHVANIILEFRQLMKTSLGEKTAALLMIKGRQIKVELKITPIECFKPDGTMIDGFEVIIY